MKNFFHSKSTVIVIVIVVILGIAYFYYEGGSTASSASLLVSQPSNANIGSAELTLLGQIQSLKIDTSIFQDPGYSALQDYSVTIPSEPVGRPNPFAPYPGEVVAASATASQASPVPATGH